jgi:hypothetical protein
MRCPNMRCPTCVPPTLHFLEKQTLHAMVIRLFHGLGKKKRVDSLYSSCRCRRHCNARRSGLFRYRSLLHRLGWHKTDGWSTSWRSGLDTNGCSRCGRRRSRFRRSRRHVGKVPLGSNVFAPFLTIFNASRTRIFITSTVGRTIAALNIIVSRSTSRTRSWSQKRTDLSYR